MRHLQRGVTTVEFAIVGAVLMVLLFGVLEFGRTMFTFNALTEGTRRGARLAAVCPVGDPRPAQAAIFSEDGASLIAPDLSVGNVSVTYLNNNGTVLADPVGSYDSIRYVRVQIANYTQSLFIPFVNPTLNLPSFVATLPIESLGYSPTLQAFVAC